MGFRNAQQSNDKTDTATRLTAHSPTTESAAEQSIPAPAQMGQVWPSIERAEQHFGMEIPNESTLQRLEDHERAYGRDTHQWIAEGMPVDITGSLRDMEAFRERQAERPPEVPTNIERQNRRSVLRSEKAATETEPAGESGVPEPVRDVLSSRGQSLDPSFQRAMEDRMGDSFGDVRIHTGPSATEACESINARAFTVGNHIAFNQSEYDPESPEGQHVLAHELAHVRQQTEGAVSMLPQKDMELEVDPDPALEREAEEAAQQAMAEGPVVVNRMDCEMQIQRMPDVELLADARQEASDRFGSTDQANVSTDPEALAKEVEQLKEGQQKMMEALTEAQPGAASDGDWVEAATKGALGSLAGAGAGAAFGAAAGSVVPVVGTATGAAVGAAVSGFASDVTKETVEVLADNRPEGKGVELERMYEDIREMYNELKDEGIGHGGHHASIEW